MQSVTLDRTQLSHLTPDQRSRFLNRVVDRAIRNHALNCGIARVEKWASEWLDGVESSRRRQEASQAGLAALRRQIEARGYICGLMELLTAKSAQAACNSASAALQHAYYARVPEWTDRASNMFYDVLGQAKLAAIYSTLDQTEALEVENQLQLADLQAVLSEVKQP